MSINLISAFATQKFCMVLYETSKSYSFTTHYVGSAQLSQYTFKYLNAVCYSKVHLTH